MLVSKQLSVAVLALCALGVAAPATAAADWQLVLSDRSRRVEIDRSSIFSSDPGTKVAWGRVVLTDREATAEGYAMVKALNRYDCQNRSFLTVKRVYVDAEDHLLGEEVLDDQLAPQRPAPNSVDERMWREVCRPGDSRGTHASEAARVASEIHRLVAALESGDRSQFDVDPEPRLSPPQRSAAPAPAVAAAAAVPVRAVAEPLAEPPGEPAEEVRADPIAQLIGGDFAASAAAAVPLAAAAGWSYEGATGPAAWAGLDPAWAVCGQGRRQAPIELAASLPVALEPVRMYYQRSGMRVHERAQTLAVEISEGMGMEVRGVRYVLESFTFHRPAPEDAVHYGHDLAAYFHHRSIDGQAAVLVVQLRAGEQPNQLIDVLLANLPLERGTGFVPETIIDLAEFMPRDPGHFLYMGSLPTPPCTEGVLWVVMKALQPLSHQQLAAIARLHPPNARPLQPVEGRLILESR